MNSPIRVVCEGCLRSIEYDPADGPVSEASCPHCGKALDGPLSEADTRVRPTPVVDEDGHSPETIDWADAWTRGTLGTVGRFQLRERLGDGGFGQVYLAYDPRLDRDVALKVLKQPEPTDRVMERFFREARAVARLDHPNIVPVLDAGSDGGRCWVAYQLVSGRPLWWYRDRQRMDPATAARIVRDLADAVNHAHSMGVVHRDIKPGNVMIDDRGRPRLIDFGLARRSDVESDLTRDGVVVGTPTYMSPEQAVGRSRQADERSDVYSLGVIFYELLCGRRPQEVLGESDDPPPAPRTPPKVLPDVRSINRAVPRRLAAISARAMSPVPADRYPSARALAETIDAWLSSRRGPSYRVRAGVLAVVGFVGLAAAAISVPRKVERSSTSPPAAPAARIDSISAPASSAPGAGPSAAWWDLMALSTPDAVVVSRGSSPKKYHIPSCSSARLIKDGNRIIFPSAEAAIQKGYKPCDHCLGSGQSRAPENKEDGP